VSGAPILRVAVIGVLAVAASWTAAATQSQDGEFVGPIRCDALPRQPALRTRVTMTVDEGQARYEREIHHPTGGPSGIFERGEGSVGPAGELMRSPS
jgi:hypothetical protein